MNETPRPAPADAATLPAAPEGAGKFVRFVFAAGASVPVNIGVRILVSRWLPYEVAVLVSHVAGMLTAFALTRLFVFGASGRPVASELGRFALVNVYSAAQTWVVSVGLVYWVFPRIGFTARPELVAHLAGLAASSVTSFIVHSSYSFRKDGTPSPG